MGQGADPGIYMGQRSELIHFPQHGEAKKVGVSYVWFVIVRKCQVE